MEFKRAHTRFHILFLTKWYPNRNDPQIGVYVRKHAKAAAASCDVSLLYVASHRALEKKYVCEITEEHGFFEVKVYYRRSSFLFTNVIRYFSAYRKGLNRVRNKYGRPDLVNLNVLPGHGQMAMLLKTRKKIPFIVTEHWTGYASGKFSELPAPEKSRMKKVCSEAEAVITVSKGLQDSMEKCGFRNHFFVVPNIVDVPKELPPARSNAKKIVLTVADLVDEKKNISATIRAVKMISSIKHNFEFHIIGGGEDETKLKELAAGLQLLDTVVFFHGMQPNKYVLDFLEQIDFVVVNSNWETFSVITAEALGCGKPVIATICGGPEYIITPDTGILIKKNSEKELELAMLYMLDNHHSYNPQKLRESVKERFSEQAVGQMLYEIYKVCATQFEIGLSGEKAHLHPDWLVLDVGSGHRPNKRADVLLDNELNETVHRSGKKALVPNEKQMVVGDALSMPFADKQFDFVIASHIAEHVDDPQRLCAELCRVGKRGYIETPGALDEFFLNEKFHKWVVKREGARLVFREKKKFRPFSGFLYRLYYLNEERSGHGSMHSKNPVVVFFSNLLRKIIRSSPGAFTRLYWEDDIQTRVIRNEKAR